MNNWSVQNQINLKKKRDNFLRYKVVAVILASEYDYAKYMQ